MKSNIDKCHLFVITNDIAAIATEHFSVRMLTWDVSIDGKLNFDSHINHLFSTASKILNALTRVTPWMSLEKQQSSWINSLMHSLINHCPFIWMLLSHKNNSKIKTLHEKCLQLIYSHKKIILWKSFSKNQFSLHTP